MELSNLDQGAIGQLKSSPVIRRHTDNPVLSAKDVPYESLLVCNAGVAKYQGRYVMVFRDSYGGRSQTMHPEHTCLGLAESRDGITWDVRPKPCFEMSDEETICASDPRLTVINGRCYMCFAALGRHGIRGAIAVTDDFDTFEILSMSVPDNRNLVLFPEKIDGMFIRLERPFPVYGRGGVDRFDIWLSESPDLRHWGNSKLVLGVEGVPFANDKIGPGAPPVKTDAGWLVIFHAVDLDPTRGKNGWEPTWKKRYTAGVMLLDLNDPSKIVGLSKEPLLVPEASYETSGGFRNNVIFPGAAILEDTNEVKIYYGAADTVECLATAHLDDLVKLCK